MRDFKFLKEELTKKHEVIDNSEYLDKYINLLLNYEVGGLEYSEKHHILTRSVFPEFENESWNIIEIDYVSHKLAHLYLFKAINDRRYQRPLNWMMNYYKNSEEMSNASKRGWVNLKNDEEKYNKWRKSKSKSMKDLSSEEQSRRANIFWKNINDDLYIKFCKQMKDYWTDEKKKEKSKQMKDFYLNPENVEKKRKETQDKWNVRDVKYRHKFKEKMSIINKDIDKRLDAGEKIKKKWEDPDYLEKMKNRKTKPGTSHKIIYKNGVEKIFETLKKMEKELNFSMHLIRKYRDTNIGISEEHLKKENIILLNCKIETIK